MLFEFHRYKPIASCSASRTDSYGARSAFHASADPKHLSDNGDRDDATWHGTSHITYVEDRDGRQTRRTRSNGGDVDWLFFGSGSAIFADVLWLRHIALCLDAPAH
jgi:hypothetical protein